MSAEDAPKDVENDVDIDDAWEKFSKDGCPDWWLMAKYTSGWLARLPSASFRDRLAPASVSATVTQSRSSPEVELQQAARMAEVAASASSAPPARACSLDADIAATPAALPAAAAAAPPLPPAAAGTAEAAAAAAPAGVTCGPLKGLFACQCVAQPGSTGKALGQATT